MILKKKINIAVVGLGNIGRRHINIISNNINFNLCAICDHDKDLKNAADVPFFLSIESLLQSSISLDVITLATPNYLHFDQCIEILKEGHYVIPEKPICLRQEEIFHLRNLPNDGVNRIIPVTQNRFSTNYILLKSLLTQKKFGRLFIVSINGFWNRDEAYYKRSNWHGKKSFDGGILFTQFYHYIDLLVTLFGRVNIINCEGFNFNHPYLSEHLDSIVANIHIETGGICNLCFTTSVYQSTFESSITVIGEKGSIKIGGSYLEKLLFYNIKSEEFEFSKQQFDDRFENELNYQHFYDHVKEIVENGSDNSLAVSEVGEVICFIEKIYDCVKNN